MARSTGKDVLIRMLRDSGVLAPGWEAAFRDVPRAAFLPRIIWPFDTATAQSTRVDRDTDLIAWERWADSDVPITVQWDDGHPCSGPAEALPTSSASMPSLVAAMLHDLDVEPGHRVLEVGTGTGWNAALLAHRLGGGAVTTLEVDSGIANRARRTLAQAGSDVCVVSGDGLRGCANRAPYDRTIATCGLRTIPADLIAQTRPGGIILAPWGTNYSPVDAVARLIVADDGASASGRFTGPAQFMKARAQRTPPPDHSSYLHDWPGERAGTDLTPDDIAPYMSFDGPGFALGLLVKAATHHRHDHADGTDLWFYSLSDRSWALLSAPSGHVHQSGPRRLWDEVVRAWHWWDSRSRPGVQRFGLTATSVGHKVWIDRPDRPLPDLTISTIG